MILIWLGANSMYAQNNVLNFDGPVNATYDYIEVPDDASLDFTTSFTFETWVKFDFITRFSDGWDWQCFFAKSRFTESYGLMLLTERTKTLRFYHAGFGTGFTDYNWTSSLSANTWYHVAVTFNGTKTAIYINGTEVASQTASAGSVTPNNNSLQIGAGSTGGGDPYPLDGNLEETRLWNIARSEAELNSTMNTELMGTESGLVLYYKYNQGTAGTDNTSITEVIDSSISGNNGTLNQFALDGSASNFIDGVEDQTITFGALSDVTYGDANFDLSATTSSGLDITYTSSDTSVATISGNTVTIVGAGTTTVTASQSGNSVYNAAMDIPQILTVNMLPIEVTADAKTKYVGAADPEFTYAITSGTLVGGDTFTGSLNRATGETIGTYAINLGTLSNTNYDITFVSNDLTILNPSAIVWDGSTSTDWMVGTNWDTGMAPVAGNDVTIPNVAASPTITSGTNTEVNTLTIDASSSLAIDGGLIVNADFTNNGSVTMTSSGSSSATLLVKGASNGMITYERGGLVANKWSIVTAPVSGQSIKDFVENPANDIRINTTVTPNRYAVGFYDDSRPTGTKWVYYTTDDLITNTLTFEKGRSYTISRATDGAIIFTGTIETSDVNKSVVASEWNAVGNPYTAYIPVNENGGVNFIQDNISNLDPTYNEVYIWDNTQDKYVASSLASSARSLAPGQGFFVRTGTGVSSITFKESLRTTQNVGGVFKGIQRIPSIALQVSSNDIKVITKIDYRTNATLELDPGFDIGNFDGANLDVFTHLVSGTSKTNLTYQSLPEEALENKVIPVGLKAKAGSEVVFTANMTDLPTGTEVYLEDKELNNFIKLEPTTAYEIQAKENINGVGRFFLHTKSGKSTVSDFTKENINIYNTDSELIISGIEENNFEIKLHDTLGGVIFKGSYKGTGKNRINLPEVARGIYIVRVTTESITKNKKIIIEK